MLYIDSSDIVIDYYISVKLYLEKCLVFTSLYYYYNHDELFSVRRIFN